MNSTFWTNVKTQMRKKKVSQQETAEGCGINWNTFRGWIYKDIIPIATDAYIIAQFLDVSLEYLITGKNIKTEQEIIKIRTQLQHIDKQLVRIQIRTNN